MSGGLSGIPEPVMPEHDLLSGAAPRIQLSAELRQRVVGQAVSQYYAGRRQRVLVRAGVVATVLLCIAGAVWQMTQPSPAVSGFQPQSSAVSASPSETAARVPATYQPATSQQQTAETALPQEQLPAQE
jgi:hypothetical protein